MASFGNTSIVPSPAPSAGEVVWESPPRQESPANCSLRAIFRRHQSRILLAYGLFTAENLTRLAIPLFLGKAIDGLLGGSLSDLYCYAGLQLANSAASAARQVVDTRTYSAITAEIAAGLVTRQRSEQVGISQVAARSVLSRGVAEFFERYIPVLIRSAYSLAGALVMLVQFDPLVAFLCLILVVPASVLALVYHRQTRRFSMGLHDELEREVDVIQEQPADEIRRHYRRVAAWQVRLSDREALHFAAMEGMVLLLVVVSLRHSSLSLSDAGRVFAVFQYLQMFVMGLDPLPALIQQAGRLQDILRRIAAAR